MIHVALVSPEIPWNTGNSGRSALAAGAQLHLVRPLGFALTERELRRAGLDYWQHVGARVWGSWDEFEREIPELGEPYFFSARAERDYWDVEYPRDCVLAFGSERTGLPDGVREHYAERLIRMPIASPHVRSLNLSTAVGVALYEVLRQQRAGGLAARP
ncbi:MAG: tRNA (cytidine(34)-2'-O)-methyltransferase [Thermoanaerobaculia bacterium]